MRPSPNRARWPEPRPLAIPVRFILPTARLSAFLHDALNLTNDPISVHPVILREFNQGQAGIITSRALDGSTIMEHAPQGLLAINRGLTEPERRFLPPPDDTVTWKRTAVPDGWHPDALQQLARFTHVLDQQIPRAHAEWVLAEDQPQFIDVSITNQPAPASATSTNVGATVITGLLARSCGFDRRGGLTGGVAVSLPV